MSKAEKSQIQNSSSDDCAFANHSFFVHSSDHIRCYYMELVVLAFISFNLIAQAGSRAINRHLM